MRHLTASLLFLAACGGDKSDDTATETPITDADTDTDTDSDADADTDTDTDTDTDLCAAVIDTVEPAPNFQLAPTDQVVAVRFDGPILATDPWSLGLAGVTGAAELDADLRGATFTPDAPLQPDTLYTVEASVCGDVQSASFRTLPDPVDAADVEAVTYAVDFDDVSIVEPPNAAALEQFLPIDFIVVQVASVDVAAELIQAHGAIAADVDGVPQIDCGAAVDNLDVDFSVNPFFTMGPTTLFVDAGTVAIPIRDFTLLGKFSPDGSEIQDVRVSGLVDLESEPSGIGCGFAAALTGGSCLPCTQGAVANHCLMLDATAPSGAADARFDIEAECFSAM